MPPKSTLAMPIREWSRANPNLFHDFHQTWTVNTANALNRGLLPKGSSALIERHDTRTPRKKGTSATKMLADRGNRVAIHRPFAQVVCVIEIVSPGNKSSRAALRRFVEKTVEFLRGGVNLLIVDLFPPSVRDPQGIHKAIWDEIEDQPFELPPDRPLTLAAYVAGEVKTAYVEPVGIGHALPDMPAWLDEDSNVPVPLESTYQATWASCPADMRNVVMHGAPLDDKVE